MDRTDESSSEEQLPTFFERLIEYNENRKSQYSYQNRDRQKKTGTAFIVLLIILIVFTAFIEAWISPPFTGPDKYTPHFETQCYNSTDGNYVVEVGVFSLGNSTGVRQSEYFLVFPNGTTSEFGRVSDIYGQDISLADTNITFCDEDFDGALSTGDIFIIKATRNGGNAVDGFSLTFKYSESDEVMSKAVLEAENDRLFYPGSTTARWIVTESNESGIRFGWATISTYRSLYWQWSLITVQIQSSGKEPMQDTNLSLVAMDDDVVYYVNDSIVLDNETYTSIEWNYRNNDSKYYSWNTDHINHTLRNLAVRLYNRDSNEIIFTIETSITLVQARETVPSFSPDPFRITLALAVVLTTALVRTSKRRRG